MSNILTLQKSKHSPHPKSRRGSCSSSPPLEANRRGRQTSGRFGPQKTRVGSGVLFDCCCPVGFFLFRSKVVLHLSPCDGPWTRAGPIFPWVCLPGPKRGKASLPQRRGWRGRRRLGLSQKRAQTDRNEGRPAEQSLLGDAVRERGSSQRVRGEQKSLAVPGAGNRELANKAAEHRSCVSRAPPALSTLKGLPRCYRGFWSRTTFFEAV
mmetsp:Transcript_9975/g.21938  ORF Transcript_9975/g.21938 Transcript_9975/m.21938 type:complete len:209 (+) Transcript_9975:674-1300(+)